MAFNVYAQLTVNGTELTGETMMTSIGDSDVSSDHIEIFELSVGSESAVSKSGKATRRRSRSVLMPVRFIKRTDRTTPLLYEALHNGHAVEGEFKLFDADPETSEIRQHFGISITKAFVVTMTTTSADVFDPEDANRPVFDFVELVAQTIGYEDTVHSTEFVAGEGTAMVSKKSKTRKKNKKKK